jgi:N-acylneuraminate cytidylyltransferase
VTFTALICARGGSKGLPGKNTRLLDGRPLIGWAVAHARAVPRIGRVIVSTDDEVIAQAARDAGADVPFMRPAELAQDTSPEWLVWRHALTWMKASDGEYPGGLVVVPATAPLRAPEDVERCLDRFAIGDVDVVITVTDAHRSPYFNMVSPRVDGTVGLVIPPSGPVVRRQDVPVVYDMTTVAYVARPAFVMEQSGLFAGRVGSVHIPQARSIDIDTPLDFEMAEWLLARTRASRGHTT